MQKLIVDSDVIIDYLRTGEGRFLQVIKMAKQNKARLYISAVTVIELYSGRSDKQRVLIEKIIDKIQVVTIDTGLAREVGKVRKDHKSMSLADLIIGVTTMWLEAKLVTGNRRHFEDLEVKMWE
jgi:predicted nucleic acid-binding protein